MPKRWRQEWRKAVAVIATYLVAVQALLAGASIVVSAIPALQDADGFIICRSTSAHIPPGDSDRVPAGPHLPSCCILDCSMFGAAVASPSVTAALLVLRPHARQIGPMLYLGPFGSRPEHTAFSPRAPPLTF